MYVQAFCIILFVAVHINVCFGASQHIDESMEIYLKDQLLNGELKDILFSSDTGNTNRNDKQYYSIKSTLSSSSSDQHHTKIVEVINNYMEHHLVKSDKTRQGRMTALKASQSFLELQAYTKQKLRTSTSAKGIIKGIRSVCQRKLNY